MTLAEKLFVPITALRVEKLFRGSLGAVDWQAKDL